MVLVRAQDSDGVVGWGEAWCNFPTVGAEHRARLVASVLAPLVEGRRFDDPPQAFARLTDVRAVLAIQSGEPGPLAQSIAAVDIALWDLAAQKSGVPLWKHLGGSSPVVNVYASGLNPDSPEKLARARREEGHGAFKLKVGFGADRDIANLHALRSALGKDAKIMIDANQAWHRDEAAAMLPRLEPFGLAWLEEPMRADSPWDEWASLANATRIPLAAGENIASDEAFDAAIASRALGVIQPDMAKWGGFTRCLPVARRIRAAGLRYCPHFLGGGVGQLASAHLLAAVGGDGLLEIDANPNPLRERTCGTLQRISNGTARLGDEPGLGANVDLDALQEFRVA